MSILKVTEQQLRLIQRALDFYSSIGAGQFDKIKDHPTFEAHLHNEFALGDGPFKVGDKTTRGEIVEISPKSKWIKTKGRWGNEEEIKTWKDVENIKYSTDYTRYHSVRDAVDQMLVQPRNLLYNSSTLGINGSWTIHNPNVDESCREAFDILQVIRHEFWKRDSKRNSMTVDSHIHFTNKNSNNIKVELDEEYN